jgi:hypothetical protein
MALPSYNLEAIQKLRRRLLEALTLEFAGCTFTGQAFDNLLSVLCEKLPDVRYAVLRESTRHLVGVIATDALLNSLAWRLAGNIRILRAGRPVQPWLRQTSPEWVPFQIVAVRRNRINLWVKGTNVERWGGDVCLRILAGSPAGMELDRFWTNAYVYTLRQEFGFDRFDRQRFTHVVAKKPSYPFSDITELTRLRAYATVMPCDGSAGLVLDRIRSSGTTKAWNKRLLKMRSRIDFPCPLSYPLELVPCHKCEKGYDQCPAGCHPVSYTARVCPECQQESWFEPLAELCIRCSRKPPDQR